ncbi:hypothetical protein ATER59S_02447 [Aquamicrobium terrae]
MPTARCLAFRTLFASACLGGLVTAVSVALPDAAAAQRMERCAQEGEICRLPYPAEVVYGARGRTTSRFIDSPAVPCSNRVFGDPAPGVSKECFVMLDARRGYDRSRDRRDPGGDGWTACAREHEFCDFRGRKRVRYGARGRFTEDVFRNGVRCDNRSFGDPAPGVSKRCYIQR